MPGPSAVLAALVLSGFPTDRFVFEGFLPRKGGRARRERIDAIGREARTVVLFEAPRRVVATLTRPGRDRAGRAPRSRVARELTKLHEEVWRGTLDERGRPRRSTTEPRGEHVIVVAPAPTTTGGRADDEVDAHVARREIGRGSLDPRRRRSQVAARLERLASPRLRRRPCALNRSAHDASPSSRYGMVVRMHAPATSNGITWTPMPQPFYVTTPIYYVNDVPHIGHAYTTVAADVLARWRRLWGDDVVFLTGTDEHGLKVQRAAEAHGRHPAGVGRPDERARSARRGTLLDITNTDFIRTTEPRHHEAVAGSSSSAVYDNGDIELGTYEGLYCVACEAYYTEDELVDGNCPIHGDPVERVTEENYFFQLSRFEDRLLEHYAAHPEAVQPDGAAQRGARASSSRACATSR